MVDKNGHVCIMKICYLLPKKLKKIRKSRILFYFHVYFNGKCGNVCP